MIDASFVQEIQKRVETKAMNFGDRHFTTSPVHNLPLPNEVKAATLAVETLSGLVNYCSNLALDGLNADELILHVESYHEVSLVSKLKGESRFRDSFVTANCKGYAFQFGQFHPHTQFMIAIQSLFQEYGDRAKVMKAIGTIKSGEERTSNDDGITQRVTAAAGVALVAEADVPNPVTLKPWRTFPEIDQPPSSFVLRVQGDKSGLPHVALFEADGGLWKREAVLSIREYLIKATLGIAIVA